MPECGDRAMDPSRGSLLLSLRVLTAVLLLINGVHGIPLSGLLPFGTGPPESIPLPSGNGAVQEFAIQDTLLYSGTQVSNLVVRQQFVYITIIVNVSLLSIIGT